MSKLKTLEVQSKDVKSITAEELSTLQQSVTSQNQAQIRLGGFEMQKIIYLDEAMKAAEAVKAIQESLEEVYGAVNIDLNTGEISDVKESN
jgi:hypothetical protein